MIKLQNHLSFRRTHCSWGFWNISGGFVEDGVAEEGLRVPVKRVFFRTSHSLTFALTQACNVTAPDISLRSFWLFEENHAPKKRKPCTDDVSSRWTRAGLKIGLWLLDILVIFNPNFFDFMTAFKSCHRGPLILINIFVFYFFSQISWYLENRVCNKN